MRPLIKILIKILASLLGFLAGAFVLLILIPLLVEEGPLGGIGEEQPILIWMFYLVITLIILFVFIFFAYIAGRMTYNTICNLLLKQQDKENLVKSIPLEEENDAKNDDVQFESKKIK